MLAEKDNVEADNCKNTKGTVGIYLRENASSINDGVETDCSAEAAYTTRADRFFQWAYKSWGTS